MPTLHEHRDQFDDRNLFLQVTLGLVSLCRQFDARLLAYGPADPPAAPIDGPDRYLDFMLGLAAFSRRAIHHIASAAEPPMPTARNRAAAEPQQLPDILRRLLV